MESEGALGLCYHGYFGVECLGYVHRLCSSEYLLRPTPERYDGDPKHYLDWSIRVWSLWIHATNCSLARRICLLGYLTHS